jgi:transposase InsO family protein
MCGAKGTLLLGNARDGFNSVNPLGEKKLFLSVTKFRDMLYLYQGYLDNIEILRVQIEKWVADYNTFAPHSALGMKTPAEFVKL